VTADGSAASNLDPESDFGQTLLRDL